jgi:hypothetical protein
MRYRLRTLLILLAVGPPALSAVWITYREHRLRQEQQLRLWMTITPPLIILEEKESTLGIQPSEP